MKKTTRILAILALSLWGAGCAAWNAEPYGRHLVYNYQFPAAASALSSSPIPVVAPVQQAAPVASVSPQAPQEGVLKRGLCEPRPRKTSPYNNMKYIVVGSDPVDPDRYYDPSTEVIFYLLKDTFLTVERGKGKTRGWARGWIEEGTVIVADKATYRALRVCKCGNSIKEEIYFDAINSKKGGG